MKKYTSINKKSQIWGFDLMMAVIIFLVGIIAIYIYALNFSGESQDILDSLFYEGNLASSLILSEGSPENWTLGNVEIPGILTDKKINQTKLDNLYSLNENYENLKKLLGTKYEFYFNFTDMEITGTGSIEGLGRKAENPENLVRIERFSVYKNKPVKFVLFIWD